MGNLEPVIWSHLLKKSLMKNFIFYAVIVLPKLEFTIQKLKMETAKQCMNLFNTTEEAG